MFVSMYIAKKILNSVFILSSYIFILFQSSKTNQIWFNAKVYFNLQRCIKLAIYDWLSSKRERYLAPPTYFFEIL